MSTPEEQTANPFGEHLLAAIVFTDVVDYSARMGRDEAATLRAVEADFRRLRQLCTRYGGTVHNTMGDGMLMCFTSATHAVICALRVQQEFATRSKTDPDALRHRIGIHMGDVTLGAEGVAGDGVNIAARILTLAAPGGACLSETVHRAVKSQMRLKVESLGAPSLKNIADPVQVCRVDIQESRLPMRARIALPGTRSRWWAAAVATVVVLGVPGGMWFAKRPPKPLVAMPAAIETKSLNNASSAKSIAVLPFTDLSPARDQEYLSDGLTDELINTLARLPGVRVAARTSAFAFKGRNVSAIEIGRELRVGKLIEGSVRRADSRVRIAVRMTNTTDGFQLWSETFDREPKDVLTLQVEIARTIAQKLQVELGGGARDSVGRLATDSVEAYNLYLRGRQVLHRRGTDTSEAQRLFEGAIATDQYYSLAFSGVAECHALRAFHGRLVATEAMPLALAAANRARELDPELADAYATMGFVRLFFDWDTRGSEEMFQRALERNADHVGALSWQAVALLNRGDNDAAVTAAARSTELDPLSPLANALRGWMLLLARRPADAKPWLEKACELDADFSLGRALLGQQADAARDYAGALAQFELGLQRSPANALLLAHRARALGLLGRSEEARAALRELGERRQRGYVRAYLFAVAASGLGDAEKGVVLDALERAVAERDLGIATLRHAAAFDSLRGEGRFQQIEMSAGAKLWSERLRR